MFDKKKIVDTSYKDIVADEFQKFLERIRALEAETNQITNSLAVKELEWQNNITDYKKDLRMIKLREDDLKIRTEQIKRNFISVVLDFKNTALSEDYSKLKKRIDIWKLDKFITHDEFNRILDGRF